MFLIHENNLYKNQYVSFLILGVAYTQLIDLNIFYIFITPDWSLPTTVPDLSGFNQTGSQMGNLFYTQLGGVAGSSIATTHNANYDLFTNVQNNMYWSGSEYAPVPNSAWYFHSSYGLQGYHYKVNQFYAWAVRPGDVAAVPVPGAFWLFGSALVALTGLKRRGSIG